MKKYLHLPGEIILQFLQDNEAQLQAGAMHYERTSSRKAHGNGYRNRSLKTRYGTLHRCLKDIHV